ncbi:MAG TPA: hypothetical protein VGN72_01070, partial [Tepidisphaeraceae bacterium]|nr:hypothetical protein [Tepidisphaeraceae bacterium]
TNNHETGVTYPIDVRRITILRNNIIGGRIYTTGRNWGEPGAQVSRQIASDYNRFKPDASGVCWRFFRTDMRTLPQMRAFGFEVNGAIV